MKRSLFLLVCGSVLVSACVALPPPPEPTFDKPADQSAAKPLRLGERAGGHVRGPSTPRQRYLVKLSEPGTMHLSASWNIQNGLDRVLIQRGNTAPMQTLDCRQRLKGDLKFQAQPGYYYIEVVPGVEEASYNLVVSLERP